MYIQPNTNIRILKNCPLDTSYDHTLYFATKAAQTAYFQGLTKYNLTQQTYQRVQRGYMKVNYKAEDLYDCNYIMFQNTSFGDKWFYAFITSVEYVNNTVSTIRFQIDVMQTWFFDYSLDACFVEREHSTTDVAGDNLVTENIGYGDYMTGYQSGTGLFDDWKIVVAKAANRIGVPTDIDVYDKFVSQVKYDVYSINEGGLSSLEGYLSDIGLLNNPDSCVDIFMLPEQFVVSGCRDDAVQPSDEIGEYNTPITFQRNIVQTKVGDYTPRNKKLLTYPYNFLSVDNRQGGKLDLHYEYFELTAADEGKASFDVYFSGTVNPTVMLAPKHYKTGSTSSSITECLFKNDFPRVPYATTDMMAKLVQRGMGFALASMTSPASIMTTAMGNAASLPAKGGNPPQLPRWSGEPIPFDDGAQNNSGAQTTIVPSTPQNAAIHQLVSGLVYGHHTSTSNSQSDNLWVNVQNQFDFVFSRIHIRPEFARIIDDYFDRFGYATMRNKVPNTHSRPHWNYVKTQACTITGSIPCDDAKFICSIYDRGITFWKSGSEVGDYSLDNSPV